MTITDPTRDLAATLAGRHQVPTDPEARQMWRIDDDALATWALRKIAEAQAELHRIKEAAENEVQAIRAWEEAASAGPGHDVDFFTQRLIDYRRRLEAERPDLAATYKLPGGKLIRRKAPDTIEVLDEEAFTTWALENDRDAVRVSPLKSQLKAKGRYAAALPPNPQGGDEAPILTTEGEKVPGVAYVVGEYVRKVDATPTTQADLDDEDGAA